MNKQLRPPYFVLEWCKRLGAKENTLIPLSGGLNSLVFRCTSAGQHFILKGYSEKGGTARERFERETSFLNYARNVADCYVPKIIYSDESSGSVVLEYLNGTSFDSGLSVNSSSVGQAVDFMFKINSPAYKKGANVFPAKDGFTKISDHLDEVRSRVLRMRHGHLPKALSPLARRIIDALNQQLEKVSECVLEKIGVENIFPDQLEDIHLCISPSDFGFHNAIKTSRGLKFFDFEYAGWDDPVKAVIDFDLQPKFPIFPRIGILKRAIPTWNSSLEQRAKLLLPILRLKWACIILNPLIPTSTDAVENPSFDNISNKLLLERISAVQPYTDEDFKWPT